jgi:hypothetical protein|tara:strand:- start:1841 stop:2080 length:240 start_codon:yes stop_codon:yes gene_type:complete
MSRLRAVVGISYPDPASLAIVEKAGGLSKLTDEQRVKVKIKDVKAGGFCDDMPKKSVKDFLKWGYIRQIDGEPKKAKKE